MLAPLKLLDQLYGRLDDTIGLIPIAESDGFASLVLELPQLPAVPPDLSHAQFHSVHAARKTLCAGYGTAAEWRARGPGRLEALRTRARGLSAAWHQYDADDTGFSGFAIVGFAASSDLEDRATGDELPNALLWVPELALRAVRGQGALVLTTRLPTDRGRLRARWRSWLERLAPTLAEAAPEPSMPARLTRRGQNPDRVGWAALVERALGAIAGGELDKLVVCRRLELTSPRPIDTRRLTAALTWLYPTCEVISLARGRTRFVAATPERLLTLRGRNVEVDAVAGTASRSALARQDAALAATLRGSVKNRHEHDLVVRAIGEALADRCKRIELPSTPSVMRLNNTQHLWSSVRGELLEGHDLLQLADRLHPTPATNGYPGEPARAWLDTHEPIARGWYTGAAGILEPDLSGELWVLLRCARIRGHAAELYAGAGIVAGSDAGAEWQETEHKLAAMATALQFA